MGGDLRLFKLHHLGGESSQISCYRIYDLLYGNCYGDSVWSRKLVPFCFAEAPEELY